MLKLYENIRMFRKRAKLTQDELARLAGYTDRSSIAKIEKGLVDLPQTKIKQFADIFDVPPSTLMGWDEEDASTKDEEEAAYISELTETLYRRPGMRILFDAAKDASDDVLQKTADLLEALKNGQKK